MYISRQDTCSKPHLRGIVVQVGPVVGTNASLQRTNEAKMTPIVQAAPGAVFMLLIEIQAPLKTFTLISYKKPTTGVSHYVQQYLLGQKLPKTASDR